MIPIIKKIVASEVWQDNDVDLLPQWAETASQTEGVMLDSPASDAQILKVQISSKDVSIRCGRRWMTSHVLG